LAERILEKHSRELGSAKPELSAAAMTRLMQYAFPGNVRELENVLERALALSDGNRIEADDLLLEATSPHSDFTPPAGINSLPEYLENIEKKAILDALQKSGNNRTAAAKLLGVSFRTLRYRLAKLGLGREDDKEEEV
jgi:two-component system response regulator PilR (NtrC family)